MQRGAHTKQSRHRKRTQAMERSETTDMELLGFQAACTIYMQSRRSRGIHGFLQLQLNLKMLCQDACNASRHWSVPGRIGDCQGCMANSAVECTDCPSCIYGIS